MSNPYTYYNHLYDNGNIQLLERQPIQCPGMDVLTGFRLGLNDNLEWRYHYQCCTPSVRALECPSYFTEGSDTSYDIRDLQEHPITCKKWELLTGLQLLGSSGLRYTYRCCAFTVVDACDSLGICPDPRKW
jgi:hypothetical protein